MKLNMKEMNEDAAIEMLEWKYEKPYDFYNNEINEDTINELLDGSYKVLFDEREEVFGFMCTGEAARIPIGHQYGIYPDNFIDMGLGMNPKYTGKGYGYDFCSFIIQYINENNIGIPIRLSVATFNERAIHLYERLGFKKRDRFSTESREFITMIREG